MSRRASILALLSLTAATMGMVLAQPFRLGPIRNPRVRYLDAARLKIFPKPVLWFHRDALARPGDRQQIMDRIVTPVINKSAEPIGAVIVEFPERYSRSFTVEVFWHSGRYLGIQFTKDTKGQVPRDAFQQFFVNDDPEQ